MTPRTNSRVPTAPALRYHGAKWKLAPWIMSHFPAHECYVEPTLSSAEAGGSAAVLLNKERSWLEVYNDLNRDVVTFFRVLREQPDALISSIRFTPYAVEEWRLALEPASDLNGVEIARRFYVRAYLNFAGASTSANSGYRRQKVITNENGRTVNRVDARMTPACLAFMRISHLYQVAERLRGVQIECTTAAEVIDTYDSPDTLYYLDPPYPAGTRQRQHFGKPKCKTTAYEHELTDLQHAELAAQLRHIQGMAPSTRLRPSAATAACCTTACTRTGHASNATPGATAAAAPSNRYGSRRRPPPGRHSSRSHRR